MKVFLIIATSALAFINADVCYKDIRRVCLSSKRRNEEVTKCNAKYGVMTDRIFVDNLEGYITSNLIRSFEYLLLSTHFGNYKTTREGFRKLFKDLSDEKWDGSIELIKYITNRGGEMTWKQKQLKLSQNYELHELYSLAKALDIEEDLTVEAHNIHAKATHKGKTFHDPEVSSHIENFFILKQRDNIRKLSGYVGDVNKILQDPDSSIGLHLFDEYLKKQ